MTGTWGGIVAEICRFNRMTELSLGGEPLRRLSGFVDVESGFSIVLLDCRMVLKLEIHQKPKREMLHEVLRTYLGWI